MTEPDGELIYNDELSLDEFNADQLDPNQLDDEGNLPEELVVDTPQKKRPVFLARQQRIWFSILLIVIFGFVLRFIFGPPWIDRFRYIRLPVAVAQGNDLIGAIVPVQYSNKLFLVDSGGHIRGIRNLGKIIPGPVDLEMGKDFYYYLVGGGAGVGIRKYAEDDPPKKYDIDLQEFRMKYRDGIDIIHSKDRSEYLNVFSSEELITLHKDSFLWKQFQRYDVDDWKENIALLDLAQNHGIIESGASFFLLDFQGFLDSFKTYNESTYLKELKQRPPFQSEFVYKPAILIPAKKSGMDIDFFLLKNDRIFNLPYKYGDDQVYIKKIGSTDLEVFTHPAFEGKDIRGMAVVPPGSDSKTKSAQLAIVYETKNEFHMAGIDIMRETPLWDISLTSADSGTI